MIEEFDINQLIEDDFQEYMESDEEKDRGAKPNSKKPRKRGEGKSIELFPTEREELFQFMMKNSGGRSRTTMKSYLTNRQVTINGIVQKQFDFMLRPDDKVVINLGTTGSEFRHPMLRIVYEDDYLLVIDKKYGLLSMGTDTERTRTAYYILSEYLKKQDSSNRIFIVHRLDRETSGLMLFAKSMEVQHLFQQNWNENVLERKYIAVIEGFPKQEEGLIKSYLAENKAFNVYVTMNPNEGELAITAFKVLRKGKDNTLVELELETGKKNQIRVHM
ncbi:MAG: pseudouridine synthase, partial [Rikenellaceae bacterium]